MGCSSHDLIVHAVCDPLGKKSKKYSTIMLRVTEVREAKK